MNLSVKFVGLDRLNSNLDKLSKQIRFAAAKSLTKVAWNIAREEQKEVERIFDKPTPFIKKSFGVNMATPATLTATVYIKPRQAAVLDPHIEGGRRNQKAFERKLAGETKLSGYWVPASGIKVNAYGNMSLATIKQIAAGLQKSGKFGEIFIGVPEGHPSAPFGLWARPKRNRKSPPKPLLIRTDQPIYRKRFAFFEIAVRTVQRDLQAEFDKALSAALASAR